MAVEETQMDNEWSTDFTLPLLSLLQATGNETAAIVKFQAICRWVSLPPEVSVNELVFWLVLSLNLAEQGGHSINLGEAVATSSNYCSPRLPSPHCPQGLSP